MPLLRDRPSLALSAEGEGLCLLPDFAGILRGLFKCPLVTGSALCPIYLDVHSRHKDGLDTMTLLGEEPQSCAWKSLQSPMSYGLELVLAKPGFFPGQVLEKAGPKRVGTGPQ